MRNMYKLLFIFLLIPLAINASNEKGKYTKKKVLTKEYTVNANATLDVSNKFGNITIITGNSNKIEIEVTITTSGDNEEKVAQRLREINVKFSGNSSLVSAKTTIEKSVKSWNVWGRKNNVNMEINYIIKMPVTNNVDITNDYGGIGLNKLEGSAKINCDYGEITIGELLNSNNYINMDYTNKSTIEYIKNGDVNADYSALSIEKAGKITLNADYSHISFGTVADLNYNCDYGDLKIDDCGNMSGNSDYMHTTVNKLSGSGIFDIDFGSLKINLLGTNFKRVSVESSYTQIKLGVNSENNFNIEASLSYGNLKRGDNFTFNKEITKNTSKYYKGYYNSPNSNSYISIDTSYGNVTFTNNE